MILLWRGGVDVVSSEQVPGALKDTSETDIDFLKRAWFKKKRMAFKE